MTDIPDYTQRFIALPPFTNIDESEAIETSVVETFKQLEIKHSPYFCCQTIFQEDNKEWDRMLYICDDKIPLIAFYYADSFGHSVFVDCYGNLFNNELKLLQSNNCSKYYYKYYNAKKIFNVKPFTSDKEYLEGIVENFEMLDSKEMKKMLEMFIEKLNPKNAIKALKIIKNYYRFFIQLSRNVDRITDLKIGNPSQILIIKLFEQKRNLETTIEVNMEKLSNEASYMTFVKLMWRINIENADDQKIDAEIVTVESLPAGMPEPGFSNSMENYLITMNRNFEESPDFLTKCNTVANRISEEMFQGRVTLSKFKNIVLWLRERLSIEYETVEEVIAEYRYLFNEINNYQFKNYKYLNTHSALLHIYKHFDDMINMKCFANSKRILNLGPFNNSENIIDKLIKTRNHTRLLRDCFGFYFNFVPTKLFKTENLVYYQLSDTYQAFNYTTDEIAGAQVKFGETGALSIATMFGVVQNQGDLELSDGQLTDFKNENE